MRPPPPPPPQYIAECKDMGIPLLPPDVNQSGADFTVVEEGIRFGLVALKGVGRNFIANLLAEHILALCDVLGHLLGGVQHGGEQGGHVLLGVVALEPGGLVAHDGVDQGVGLIGLSGPAQPNRAGRRGQDGSGEGAGLLPQRHSGERPRHHGYATG